MYICIDLGGTNLRGTWINRTGQSGPVQVCSRPKTLDGTKDALCSIINTIEKECSEPVLAVGLASAGPMDFVRGTYLNPTNMPELKGFNLKSFIARKTGCNVVLENDAQAAALGEIFRGCLAGAEDALVFTLGTGLGSGVVINNKIWRGKIAGGPELGHLYLGPGRKIRCGCGQTGCAETWLNASALKHLVFKNGIRLESLKELDNLLFNNNAQACRIMEQYGRRLGLYLCQVLSVFGIPRVALSGGLSRLGPFFLQATQETIRYRLSRREWLIPETILCSPDPEMSALWGMCYLMIQKH